MPPPSKAASGQGLHLINSQSAHFARRPLALRCRTPLSNLSLSSSGDISEPTYLDSTEYSKNYQPPPRKNTLRSTAHRSLPQRMNQSHLTLQKPPPIIYHHPISSKFSFRRLCKVSSGKHECAYQSTILTLRFPRPAQTPRRDKIDKTRREILSSVFRY